MKRLSFLIASLAVLVVAGLAQGASSKPAIRYVDDRFGAILTTPKMIVRSKAAVPRKIAGISGTFSTIRRPDGRLQVKHNGLAVYTYANESPEQVLCDNVNGWFVVRLRR